MKRDIKTLAIAFLEFLPCMLIFWEAFGLIGILHTFALSAYWGGTDNGREFLSRAIRSSLRIERRILGANA